MSSHAEELERLGRALESDAVDQYRDPDQVDPALIWDAAQGDLPPDQVASLADRAAADPELAADWRLAVAFSCERKQAGGGRILAFLPRGRRMRAALLAAAAVIALAVILPAVRHRLGPTQISYRGAVSGPITAGEATLPEEPDDPLVLRWSCTVETVSFQIVLSDENLVILGNTTGLTEARFSVQAKTLKKLPPGSVILWQVFALTPDGRRIASPTFIEHLPGS